MTGLYFHSTQESSVCDQVSSEWTLLTDGLYTEPKTFKVGEHTSFKSLSNTLHVPFPL